MFFVRLSPLRKIAKNDTIVGMPSRQSYRQTGIILVALLLVLLVVPEPALAAGKPFGPSFVSGVAKAVALLITGLNMLTWVMFIFLNFLMDPSFMFDIKPDGTSPFLNILNSIWVLSRDLMNLVFALILIAAAIYTIVTAKKDFIIEHYKKFILAVILVNFSWFLPRIVLDVANISAASVYGIPSLIGNQFNIAKCKVKGATCKAVVDAEMLMNDRRVAELSTPQKKAEGWSCQLGNLLCVKMEDLDANSVAGHSAILNGLIINHAKLQSLAQVPPPIDADDVGQIIVFMMREALILVLHVALFFPLLAMVVAFAIRVPVLWITIAFMPFYFLGFVYEKLSLGGETEKILKFFLKAAFLPAIVAIPLSIGFIMINAGSQLTDPGLGGIKIRLLDQIGNFWELLWLGMSLGVMWVGVFTALSKIEFAAKISQSIRSIGEATGRLVLKAPLALPIIPGPGGMTSPLFALKTMDPRNLENTIAGKKGLGEVLDKWRGAPGSGGKGHAEELSKGSRESLTKLDALHRDLEALKNLPRGTDPSAILAKINATTGRNDSSATIHSGIQEFITGLKEGVVRNPANKASVDPRIIKIKTAADALPPYVPPPAAAPAAGATPAAP